MTSRIRLFINAPWRMPRLSVESACRSHSRCPQQDLYFSWPETHLLGWNVPSYWRC